MPAKDVPRLTLNAWMTHVDRRCNSAGEVAARVKETASRDVPSHHRTHERTVASPPSLPSIVSISSIYASVSANPPRKQLSCRYPALNRVISRPQVAGPFHSAPVDVLKMPIDYLPCSCFTS